MTARQHAHGLIDRMPEASVQALIPVMRKLIPFRKPKDSDLLEIETDNRSITPKMQAFLDMQEMRKSSVKYSFSEKDREAALNEKYGEIIWEATE